MIITPQIWGPHAWKFLHMVAIGYPDNPTDDDKNAYFNYFIALGFVLPCSLCRDHYKKNLEKYPITQEVLSSRNNLINWTIDMHNLVNEFSNKKIYSYDEGRKLIGNNYMDDNNIIVNKNNTKDENIETIDTKENKNYFLYILIILFIGLFIIAICYKSN